MFSKKPLIAIGNFLQRWSLFKIEMFTSKSKHQSGSMIKKEKCIEGINAISSPDDAEDSLLAVNAKFLAAVVEPIMGASNDGGIFVVVPVEKTGKTDAHIPKIRGHSKSITDIKWNPFNDHEIVSASKDCTIKLWRIPEDGLTKDVTKCESVMRGHSQAVTLVEWHPCASDVLLSVGLDMKCMVWNTRIESTFIEITLNVVITSAFWSPSGCSFATLCNTGDDAAGGGGGQTVMVVEPRTGSSLVRTKLEEADCGVKKIFFVAEDKLVGVSSPRSTSSSSSSSGCLVVLWNLERKLNNSSLKVLKKEVVASSSSSTTGPVVPVVFYDRHQQILYVLQKGDNHIRSLKVSNEEPFLHSINDFPLSSPSFRAVAIMPVRGLDQSKNETARIYKTHSTKNICDVLSITSTTKVTEQVRYQSPTCSADQWFQGEAMSQTKPPTIKNNHLLKSSLMSSSFVHLTFSSPKLDRKSKEASHKNNGICQSQQNVNTAHGQTHFLYSDVPLSNSDAQTSPTLLSPIAQTMTNRDVRSCTSSEQEATSYKHKQVSLAKSIQNRAYIPPNYGGTNNHGMTVSSPPPHTAEPPKIVPLKKMSPRLKASHKSPTVSAVRMRRMKQKELLFHSSSSSSSSTEALDSVGKMDRWNENPLYFESSQKPRKNPFPRTKMRGHVEGHRRRASQVTNRCSVVDFAPLDSALDDVINQHQNLSKSSSDLLFEIMKREFPLNNNNNNNNNSNNNNNNSKINHHLNFNHLKTILSPNNNPIESDREPKVLPSKNQTNRSSFQLYNQPVGNFYSTTNLDKTTHHNPILNGHRNDGHYRSAFSVVKTSKNSLHANNPYLPVSRTSTDIDHGNSKPINSGQQQLNNYNNFYSTDQPSLLGRYDRIAETTNNNSRSSRLQRASSMKESTTDENLFLNRPIPVKYFPPYKQHRFNQSTPQLIATTTTELFHPLVSAPLRPSLHTITEHDIKFRSIAGPLSSSSSLNSDVTLRSDGSTVDYELEKNDLREISPQTRGQSSASSTSAAAGHKRSSSFVFAAGPVNNGVFTNWSHNCESQQEDEINKLRRELTDREVRIRMLEEKLRCVHAAK